VISSGPQIRVTDIIISLGVTRELNKCLGLREEI